MDRIGWKRPRGLLAGAALGLLAVIASGLLSQRGAPPAYGICVACHGRDFLAGLGLSAVTGSAASGGLVLTVVGVAGGAALAAAANRELRQRPARQPLRSFLLGLAAMVASLLALGCTTRLALRAAYGDSLALWSLLGVALAIAASTGAMVWLSRRVGGLTR